MSSLHSAPTVLDDVARVRHVLAERADLLVVLLELLGHVGHLLLNLLVAIEEQS